MKRTGSIEFLRIIAAILVVIGHVGKFYFGLPSQFSNFLSIYVEFFFMVAGFFMMMHLDKKGDESENTGVYLLHKLKTFIGAICIVNFGQLFLNCAMSNVTSVGGVFEKLWHFKWEFLLLQCAGFIKNPTFNVDYLCGPSWYLSALIIATAILYPIAKNFRKVYSNIICPVVVLVIYCGFMQKYGNMNIGNDFLFVIMDAVSRGLAAMCLGSICFNIYKWLSTREENKTSKIIVSVLDSAAWLMIPGSVLIGIYGKDDCGLFMLIPFAIIIICGVLNRGVVSRLLNMVPSKITGFLGKSSLYIYVTHWTAVFATMFFMPSVDTPIQVLSVFLITIVYSALLYILDKKRKNCIPILIICSVIFIANIITCGFILH